MGMQIYTRERRKEGKKAACTFLHVDNLSRARGSSPPLLQDWAKCTLNFKILCSLLCSSPLCVRLPATIAVKIQ